MVMDLSPQGRERLARLREKYRRSLDEKRSAIAAAHRAAVAADFAPEALAEFRHLVHKLAGSAGTYGFDGIFQCADALEDTLKALQDGQGGRAALIARMERRRAALMAVLRAAVDGDDCA